MVKSKTHNQNSNLAFRLFMPNLVSKIWFFRLVWYSQNQFSIMYLKIKTLTKQSKMENVGGKWKFRCCG